MCFSFNTSNNFVSSMDLDDYTNDSFNKYDFHKDMESIVNNTSSSFNTTQNSIANKSSNYSVTYSNSPFGASERISSQNQLPKQTAIPKVQVISTPSPGKVSPAVSPMQSSQQTNELLLSSPVHRIIESDRSCSSPIRPDSPVSTTYCGQSPIHPYGQVQYLQPQQLQSQPQPYFFHDGKATSLTDENRLIGIYTVKERQQKIALFRLKKMQRIHRRHVKYITRKKLAEERPRVKGRFTTRPNMSPDMCISSLNDQEGVTLCKFTPI